MLRRDADETVSRRTAFPLSVGIRLPLNEDGRFCDGDQGSDDFAWSASAGTRRNLRLWTAYTSRFVA